MFWQTTVPANRNNVILPNLDPDTPYNIKVTAIYDDGPGGELEGNGRTCTYASPVPRVPKKTQTQTSSSKSAREQKKQNKK